MRGFAKKFYYETVFFAYRIKVKVDDFLCPHQKLKIFVTGFQHSGTSILRKIIGNHKDIQDILNEVDFRAVMRPNTSPSVYVMKSPNCDNRVFKACKIASHIKIVCIVKDPRDVLVSLEKRSGGEYHLEKFKKEWCECVQNSIAISKWPHGYLVRYEDLFKDNYREVEKLFNWLELPYDESVITKNKNRIAPIATDSIPQDEPPRTEHASFRSYQINQEFRQMSGQYKNELLREKQINIENDPLVRELMVSLKYL